MQPLAWMLAGLLRHAARLLPPGRQEYAEAVRAEAGQVPAGWPRLRWLAGGLRLVAREANVVRKVVYWIGTGAVAAAAAWAVWLSWRASPAADPVSMTDRFRVLAGVGALVVLPWAGRRRGWFGPVGGSITARLVRVAGCAVICGLGVATVRFDSHLGLGPHGPGPFSLAREITGLALLGVVLAALPLVKSRWPDAEASALWSCAGMASVVMLVILPMQTLAVVYVAGILAATSRRSRVAPATLAAGAITGLASGLVMYEAVLAVRVLDQLYVAFLILAAAACLLAAPAGAAAAWLLSGTGDPQELRAARIRQGLLAGVVAGAVGGMVLTLIGPVAVVMMVLGPLAGAAAGAVGGATAADHPRRPPSERSWAAGLFVLGRTR